MMYTVLCLLIGLGIGALSGLIGIGGGVFFVPALIWILGMNQHEAQGTTLALLVPPIGILAAWTYYRQGYVDLKIAALLCIGFLIGGYAGARLAVGLPNIVLRRIFAVALLLISLRLMLHK